MRNRKILTAGKILLWMIVGGAAAFGQKAELVVETGHSDSVFSVAFSPDGKILASGSGDKTIKLWDKKTGQELKTLTGHADWVRSLTFSRDGKILASGSSDKTIKLWNTETGQELRTLTGHGDSVFSIAFSPDGEILASGSGDKTIKLWNIETAQELKTLTGHSGLIRSVAFSPDGRTLASGSNDKTIKLWNIETGQDRKIFGRQEESAVFSVAFSPDGKILASGGGDGTIKLWDAKTGQELKTLAGHGGSIEYLAFKSDGQTLASGSWDNSIKLWNIATGQEIRKFNGHDGQIYSVAFSPDGDTLASGSRDKTIKLWNVETAQELKTLTGHSSLIRSVAFSPDGRTLASGGDDKTIKLWNTGIGQRLRTLAGHSSYIVSLAFSPDGRRLASGSGDRTIKLWDTETGREINTLAGHNSLIYTLAFSPDGKTLASGSWDDKIKLWNIETGTELKTLTGYDSYVVSIAFSPDGKTLASQSKDKTVKLWDTDKMQEVKFDRLPDWVDFSSRGEATADVNGRFFRVTADFAQIKLFNRKDGKELCTLVALDEKDWAVITPNGLFDASQDAKKMMHYAVGLEPVSLKQMKKDYYVPGLLQKIFNGELLPDIKLFSGKNLFPLAEYEQPKSDQKSFNVKLINRGGDIGQVQVFVNNKEFISDARPAGFNPNQPEATLQINLADAPFISERENKVEVVTHNALGSLNSRGSSRGAEIVQVFNYGTKAEAPNIYAIIGGVSDYTGDKLDLNYAAKDAEDFARAFEVGAIKLFGADKVHIRLLTSNGTNSNVKFNTKNAKISTAAKEDFRRAFEDFQNASPNDIFIVYLAGHGVSLNQNPQQAGGDAYLFLTQEATTTDRLTLKEENFRKAMSISSDELTELMKQNKALKQVLVLDTCAAGAAVSSLIAKRDLPSDPTRAIDELNERTGFFVLMGSAADKVSYEASQYGQGLLTYSLLQGMKGAKLQTGDYALVGDLFSYAQDTVPQMAKNIGGIQRPLILTPERSENFPIGQFTAEEQKKIVLSNPKPLILNPSLRNTAEDVGFDDLSLEKIMKSVLRGEPNKIVFVEADEMDDAVRPVGNYTVEGEILKISVKLIKNKQRLKEVAVSGKVSEPETVVSQMVEAIIQALQQ